MRLRATPASVESGIPSALAAAECLAATLIYLFICIRLDSSLPYSLAIAAAPLLLLRTTRSTDMALRCYVRILRRLIRPFGMAPLSRFRSGARGKLVAIAATVVLILCIAGIVVVPTCILISALVCRIGSTAWCALRHPVESLRSMPANWYRQALCTDLSIPPELLPGEERERLFPRFRLLIEGMRADWRDAWPIVVLFRLPLLLACYLPALLLRLSFKASSFAYAPLVWAAHASLNSKRPLAFRLERIVKSELEKLRRWVSSLVAGASLVKIAFVFGLVPAQVMHESEKDLLPGQALLNMSDWPAWQILLLIESALTFSLYFFADAAAARIERAVPWPEQRVRRIFELAILVRAALGIVTVAIFLVSAVLQLALSVRPGAAHAGFQGVFT